MASMSKRPRLRSTKSNSTTVCSFISLTNSSENDTIHKNTPYCFTNLFDGTISPNDVGTDKKRDYASKYNN